MQRVQTLKAIEVSKIVSLSDSVLIPINAMLKQFRAKKNNLTLHIKAFPEDLAICPCSALKCYMEKTKPLRGNIAQLFISFSKPHQPVTCDTLGRWMRTVMFESGIDTNIFKAHSTRAAASSAAKGSSMPIEAIMKIAGWTKAATFKKYYDKTVF